MIFNQVFIILDFNKKKFFILESNYTKFSHCWKALSRCSMLCNTATFRENSENLLKSIIHRQCDGDASEIAILKFMEASVSILFLLNIK